MPKLDAQKRIDQILSTTPVTMIQATGTVQVVQQTLPMPYAGDIWLTADGRFIVGDDPGSGARGIFGAKAIQGWDANNMQTFGVYFANYGGFGAGDLFAGNVQGTRLFYDHSAGTLSLYGASGAGFQVDQDGNLTAGLTTGAHMRWDVSQQAFQVRVGDTVKVAVNADGSASFVGDIDATGGYISGDLTVRGRLLTGDVVGPAVVLELVQDDVDTWHSEIRATDENNNPWFVVRAGGADQQGHFHLGASGDYPGQLNYDGQVLSLDGDIYARRGIFYGQMSMATYTEDGEILGGLIELGEGVFGQDFSGVRLGYVNDGDGVWQLAGYEHDVKQFYLGSDGKAYAGGRNVQFDVNGIGLVATDTAPDKGTRSTAAIDWLNGTRISARIYDYDGLAQQNFIVECPAWEDDNNANIEVSAYGGLARWGQVALYAYGNDVASNPAYVAVYSDGSTRTITLEASSISASNNPVVDVNTLTLDVLTSAPASPTNGMIAYADGTSWNPGSGAGFYGYEAGAWVKL